MGHALSFLGAVSPGMASLADPRLADIPYTKTLLPGGILGVGGALVGLQVGHPFLGFIAAESVGQNTARFIRGQGSDRTVATLQVAQAGAIVAGALAWRRHPFYGGALGLLLALLASSFVPGSNANKFAKGLLHR